MQAVYQGDWRSPEFLADPYPHYKALREKDPVHYDASRGHWLLTRYRDIVQVLRDDERFSAAQGAANSMLVSDPPDHSRLRGLVNKAFSAGMVRSLEPRIREIVEGLLDTAAEREQMDVIADFAYPLPLTVIAELLGVEPEKRDFFRRASTKIAIALGPATDAAIAMRAVEGRNELLVYFDSLIQKRRDEPRSDLVSALIQAEEAGTFLGHGELLAMLLLLLVGGHETTVNLIGNGLLALLHHPQQFALLAEEPGCEKRAVEELLRWDSPVQYSGRVAKEDLELGGKTIRAGQTLRLILGSANRDPEVFTDPDSLDLRREPCPHVAFGAGIHFCLGGQLARLEGQIALSSLVRRFPGMRLATEALRWRQAPVLRGLEALPVRLL